MSADYITQSGYLFSDIRKHTIEKGGFRLEVERGQKDVPNSACKDIIYGPLTPEDKYNHAKSYVFGAEGVAWVHVNFNKRGRVVGMTRYGSNNAELLEEYLAESMCYEG